MSMWNGQCKLKTNLHSKHKEVGGVFCGWMHRRIVGKDARWEYRFPVILLTRSIRRFGEHILDRLVEPLFKI
jgi:hypothetical protein